MDTFTIQIIIISFCIGLTTGSIAAYCWMRRALNKNMRSITQLVHSLNFHRTKRLNDYDAKKENLVLLSNKLKKIESDSNENKDEELNCHINKLNQLFSQTGIAKIKNSHKTN